MKRRTDLRRRVAAYGDIGGAKRAQDLKLQLIPRWARGEALQQRERAFQVLHRLMQGSARHGLRPGEAQILDGLGLIGAARIMMRQIRKVIVQGRGIQELDGPSHILMQLLAALLEDRVVGDLLGQRVLEDIFDVRDRRLLVDELAKLEVGEETLEFLFRVSADGPGETEDELRGRGRQVFVEATSRRCAAGRYARRG